MVSTDRLIELVKRYPPLFDSAHPDYADEPLRNKVWQHIGLTLNTDGDIMKEVWNSMFNSYVKHVKDSSVDVDQPIQRGYSYLHFLKNMEFFKPFIKCVLEPKLEVRREVEEEVKLATFSDSSDCTSLSDDDLHQKHLQSQQQSQTLPPTAKSPQICDRISEDLPIAASPRVTTFSRNSSMESKLTQHSNTSANAQVQTLLKRQPSVPFVKQPQNKDEYIQSLRSNRVQQHKKVNDVCSYQAENLYMDVPIKRWFVEGSYVPLDMDAIELIFLGYAKTVKTFSPIRQTYAKMKIAQIIMEQEIQQLDETPNIPAQFVSSAHTESMLVAAHWASEGCQSRRKSEKSRHYEDIVDMI